MESFKYLTFLTSNAMQLIEIKSATITEKGQIAIPKDARQIKGFRKGSKIAVLAFDDHIELRPMSQLENAIASEKSLAKQWNSKEDEKAWKNL
jgi:AbrB family looped-hinge helix DNA binding protein